MIAILAALAAAMVLAAPSQPADHKPPPAASQGPAPAHPAPDPGDTVSHDPKYGWRPTTPMPCRCHVWPHWPWMWQPAAWTQVADWLGAATLLTPRHDLTPGKTVDITVVELCKKKWGKDARHVTEAMKAEVFDRYGYTGHNADPKCIPDAHGKRCEIDHLISRELGGADDILNLWPQPYGGPWNAHMKDRVENRLHVEVCAGRINLLQAQTMIRDDWQGAYRKYFGDPK